MTSSIPVFDADSHLAEVPDLWTSRLPISKWGDDVPHVVYDERLKRDRWVIGGRMLTSVANWAVAGWNEFPPEHPPTVDDADPGAFEPGPRLERMDEPFLLNLPGLESLEIRHDLVQIQTRDSDATLYLEEADQAADRILVINKGRLLADGTPAEIKERAGAKRMSFRLERVDEPFLLGLPGIESLELRRDVVHIQTRDSDATLYAVLDAGYRPTEIEVSSLGLEQAFIAITAEDDRDNGPARVTRHGSTSSAAKEMSEK